MTQTIDEILEAAEKATGYPTIVPAGEDPTTLYYVIPNAPQLSAEVRRLREREKERNAESIAMNEELQRLRSRVEVLTEALRDISKQRLVGEVNEDEYDDADFEGGYDAIVRIARAALSFDKPPIA